MPFSVCVTNKAGGVGKSTTAVNLSAGLAELGHRVLLIDLDSQADSTKFLGLDPDSFEFTTYHLFDRSKTLPEIIVPLSEYGKLSIAPASLDLDAIDTGGFTSKPDWAFVLSKQIRSLKDHYDVAILDCPAALGIPTKNAIVASHMMLIPVEPDPKGLKNLRLVHRIVNEYREDLEIDLPVWHFINKADRTRISKDAQAELAIGVGDSLLPIVVPLHVGIKESTQFGKPFIHINPEHESAIQFRALAKEVENLWQRKWENPVLPDSEKISSD